MLELTRVEHHTDAHLGLATEANPMKHFTAVNYEFSKQARVVVTGKPFQTSLIFVGGARSLPYSIAP
jgi:hypothetical protein